MNLDGSPLAYYTAALRPSPRVPETRDRGGRPDPRARAVSPAPMLGTPWGGCHGGFVRAAAWFLRFLRGLKNGGTSRNEIWGRESQSREGRAGRNENGRGAVLVGPPAPGSEWRRLLNGDRDRGRGRG